MNSKARLIFVKNIKNVVWKTRLVLEYCKCKLKTAIFEILLLMPLFWQKKKTPLFSFLHASQKSFTYWRTFLRSRVAFMKNTSFLYLGTLDLVIGINNSVRHCQIWDLLFQSFLDNCNFEFWSIFYQTYLKPTLRTTGLQLMLSQRNIVANRCKSSYQTE